MLTEPLRVHEHNWYHPALEPVVATLRADAAALDGLSVLKHRFMTHGEALIHGDLHTGSVMVGGGRTVAIDPEFAFYGPVGFDLGAIWANAVIATVRGVLARPPRPTSGPTSRASCRRRGARSWASSGACGRRAWTHPSRTRMRGALGAADVGRRARVRGRQGDPPHGRLRPRHGHRDPRASRCDCGRAASSSGRAPAAGRAELRSGRPTTSRAWSGRPSRAPAGRPDRGGRPVDDGSSPVGDAPSGVWMGYVRDRWVPVDRMTRAVERPGAVRPRSIRPIPRRVPGGGPSTHIGRHARRVLRDGHSTHTVHRMMTVTG